MIESDFSAIEEYLGYPLPQPYRRLMSSYPFDTQDSNLGRALYPEVDEVLSWNSELREGEWSQEWNSQHFAIGNDACGDTYFLDLSGDSTTVYMWDHETHLVSEEAPDLDHFVAMQKADAEAAQREIRRQTEERQREQKAWYKRAGKIMLLVFLLCIGLPLLLLCLVVWMNSRRSG